MIEVLGTQQLEANLTKLRGPTADRMTTASVRGGLKVLKKAMRSFVNQSQAQPAVKRNARRLLGTSIRQKAAKGRPAQAKAGFAVGKPRGTKAIAAGLKGVGLSAANIHWFVLGTAERTIRQGKKPFPRKGMKTGKIRPLLAGIPAKALRSTKTLFMYEAARAAKAVMEKEVRKAR